jgi:hypothetical protein
MAALAQRPTAARAACAAAVLEMDSNDLSGCFGDSLIGPAGEVNTDDILEGCLDDLVAWQW